jgi:thiopurine S-methyltransferase
MDADFWLTRWQNNELGFQLDNAHPLLVQCLPSLLVNSTKVLVPLCGKSPDIHYLSGFLPVLGAELSAIACHEFFIEHQLAFNSWPVDCFRCYQSEYITLWQGDFFAMQPEHVMACDLIYDRAALIALPQPMRQQYADKLQAILPHGAKVLLISLEYPQHEKSGPPFSVSREEIDALFPNAEIELLAELELTGKGFARRRFATSSLVEKAYCITLK